MKRGVFDDRRDGAAQATLVSPLAQTSDEEVRALLDAQQHYHQPKAASAEAL